MPASTADLKAKGNHEFLANNYKTAIDYYSQAIELDKNNADTVYLLYANRSAAYLKDGNAKAAKEDAHLCTIINPKFCKGFFRLGQALEASGDPVGAFSAYTKAQQLDEDSKEISDKVRDLNKHLPREARAVTTGLHQPGNSSWNAMVDGVLANLLAKKQTVKQMDVESLKPIWSSPQKWTKKLTEEKAWEFLLDSYRLRVDDTYVFDNDCIAMYAVRAEGLDDVGPLLCHFLVFCIQAVGNGLIPATWNWAGFLEKGADCS